MSSNTGCPSNSSLCTQGYPIRDYFLALFVIVVCLVCLRMLLYVCYYTWIRIASRRQRVNSTESRPLHQGVPLTTAQSSFAPTLPSLTDSRVCVIVPGDDRPTFVAVPAPWAPSRDVDFAVTSEKAFDMPKN
eukprot:c24195_g1_i2 orf=124-519(-)